MGSSGPAETIVGGAIVFRPAGVCRHGRDFKRRELAPASEKGERCSVAARKAKDYRYSKSPRHRSAARCSFAMNISMCIAEDGTASNVDVLQPARRVVNEPL